MPGTLGVTIGEKHTLKDWNLGWTAITLGFPEPKTYELDIQGADGTLDITEAVTGGDVKYKNRSLSLEFETPDEDFFEWGSIVSDIANYLVGKKMKISQKKRTPQMRRPFSHLYDFKIYFPENSNA